MPQKVYKYFHRSEFQNKFLEQGEVYFNTLSYFLDCEDFARRDETEDKNCYLPVGGHIITDISTQEKIFETRPLLSLLKRPERAFIFSTSTKFDPSLWKKFNANGCVEISNLEEFKHRLSRVLKSAAHSVTIKNKQLLSAEVEYYDSKMPPGVRYALPDKIIMSKPASYIKAGKESSFSEESEYRFAFAKDKDGFEAYNLNMYLTATFTTDKIVKGNPITLRLGPLHDICKIMPNPLL